MMPETTDENIKKLNAVLDMESDAELIDETTLYTFGRLVLVCGAP